MNLLHGFGRINLFPFSKPNTFLYLLHLKVLRPSGPNYWKNVEWIPYVFCKEYYSECRTNRVMGQIFGTITFCHLGKLIFLIFPIGRYVKVWVT